MGWGGGGGERKKYMGEGIRGRREKKVNSGNRGSEERDESSGRGEGGVAGFTSEKRQLVSLTSFTFVGEATKSSILRE